MRRGRVTPLCSGWPVLLSVVAVAVGEQLSVSQNLVQTHEAAADSRVESSVDSTRSTPKDAFALMHQDSLAVAGLYQPGLGRQLQSNHQIGQPSPGLRATTGKRALVRHRQNMEAAAAMQEARRPGWRRREKGVQPQQPSRRTAGKSQRAGGSRARGSTRASQPPSVEELMSIAFPLPDPAHSAGYKEALRSSCTAEGRSPPSSITVAGMPNTGTNALMTLLEHRLEIESRRKYIFCGAMLWKHLMPFHPDFEDFFREACANRTDWTAMVFSVRHPLMWLQSQTTRGHGYGTLCKSNSEGGMLSQTCFIESCQHNMKETPTCSHMRPPQRWTAPSLLDIWAAFATHLPTLPSVAIVRYEDLLHDREAVLGALAQWFGLKVKKLTSNPEDNPLNNYTRYWEGRRASSTGIDESQQRLQNLERFWRQYGVNMTGRDVESSLPSGNVWCPAKDKVHQLVYPTNIAAYKSATERGVLAEALNLHGYQVPSVSAVEDAWKHCGPGQKGP